MLSHRIHPRADRARTLALATCAIVATLAFAGAAEAQSDTATLNVTFSKDASCSITGGTLAFDAAGIGETIITVNCGEGTPYKIGIGPGQNWTTPGASPAVRTLLGADNYNKLAYKLYRDAARTLEWNSATGGSAQAGLLQGDGLTGTGNGLAQNITIYGSIIDSLLNIPAQTYTDTAVIAVGF